MAGSVLDRLLSWVAGNTDVDGSTDGDRSTDGDGTTDADGASSATDPPSSDETDADDEGFLRSRLDAAVLFAHGKRSRPAQEAIDDVEERGEELEAADGDRRYPER